MHADVDSVARLSSKADYTIFSYGGKSIRFAAPYSLRRYLRVTKWHDGYLEVEADYGAGAEGLYRFAPGASESNDKPQEVFEVG